MAYWGNDQTWQSLTGPQRAAAMALLEAEVGPGGIDVDSARNALGAIINRSEAERQPLGDHVSRRIYQPIIEDNQRSRLQSVIQSPEFQDLSNLATQRLSGEVPDWVGGADHYLAPPSTMLALEAKEPNKYKSWRNWTQFNPETNQYGNVVMTDKSHHFLKLLNNNNPGQSARSTVASANTTTPTSATPASRNEDRAMLPFLSQILGMSGGAGGPWAAALETAGGGGAPATGADGGGMLSSLFGEQGMPGGQTGSNAGLNLAQGAQANAQQSATGGPLAPLQRTPVNTQNLQALLARKPMLGYGMRGAA